MRNSFVFYDSWWEAIKNLPRDVQGDVLTAIIEYGLTGETTGQLKPIAKAMLAMAKTQIDINNQRFENGKKGGRGKAKDNQTETKQKPNKNQTKTKVEPNVNDNVNDNDIKENTPDGVQKKDTVKKAPFDKFNDWLRKNAPNVLKLKTQMTEEQFGKVRATYSFKQIADILLAMENYKELTKKYTSVYLTFLKWAKKEYGTD